MTAPKTKEEINKQQSLDLKFHEGKIPFKPESLFEQLNAISRSSMFSVNVSERHIYDDFVPIFCLGPDNDTIYYSGPFLNVEHEDVWAHIISKIRGKPISERVMVSYREICLDVLKMKPCGSSYDKIDRILHDLSRAQLRITNQHAIRRVISILRDEVVAKNEDGEYLFSHIKRKYMKDVEMFEEALAKGLRCDISFHMINSRWRITDMQERCELIDLDPVTCIFFDGVNTTVVPRQARLEASAMGKKMLSYLKSHQGKVFISLENWYRLSQWSSRPYADKARSFKLKTKQTLQELEANGFIIPDWSFIKNSRKEWIITGLEVTEQIRNISLSRLTKKSVDDPFKKDYGEY